MIFHLNLRRRNEPHLPPLAFYLKICPRLIQHLANGSTVTEPARHKNAVCCLNILPCTEYHGISCAMKICRALCAMIPWECVGPLLPTFRHLSCSMKHTNFDPADALVWTPCQWHHSVMRTKRFQVCALPWRRRAAGFAWCCICARQTFHAVLILDWVVFTPLREQTTSSRCRSCRYT